MAPGLEAGGKKGVLVKGKAGDKPLLDTGALYEDFDYEVTER